MGFLSSFAKDLLWILTEPRAFFRDRFPQMKSSDALSFGIMAQWLAALLGWLTRVVKHETLFDGLNRMREKLSTLPVWKDLPETLWQQEPGGIPAAWKAEIVAIILTPFQSLAQFCIYGTLYFLGALLLIRAEEGKDPIGVAPFIRLCAVSSAPALIGSILGFLPVGIGAWVGWIYGIALLTLGISVRYRISSVRAFWVILVPGVTGLVALGCVLGVLGALFFQMFRTLFAGA